MKRRQFLKILSQSAAVLGVPAFAHALCPPKNLQVDSVTAITGSPDCGSPGGLPALVLTSAAAAGVYGWTFGQAFRKGNVPSGMNISGNTTSFQAEVRNRWSDGSVKYAVLSGISSFEQNQPVSVQLSTLSSAPVPAAFVAEPTVLNVVVTFAGAVTGAYSLQAALGVNKETWGDKTTAGRIHKILGPVMSEFHYYVPTADAHVAICFYVRRYSSGQTEVETVIENGWLNVASAGQKNYSVIISVNGATRYTATLTHLHHTRWSRVDWLGPDPQITPKHDGGYFRSTKLVPNYTTAYGLPSASTLDGLVQTAEPFGQAAWPAVMGAAGGGGSILNNWEALYITSGDKRAYRSVLANSVAAGRYGIYYRDEKTGKPPVYAAYTRHGYTGSGISSAGSADIQFPSGGDSPPDYAKSHARPFGYLAYLISGRHTFREQVEFQAQVSNFGASIGATFEDIRIPMATAGAFTSRGVAWAIRSFVAAIVAVPDADPRAGQYRTQLAKTFAYYHDNYANKNNLGVIKDYSTYNPGVSVDYTNFMQDSFTMTAAWAYQVANEHLVADKLRADAFVLWRMKHITGRMGDQTGYCYRDAATYTCRYASTDIQSASTANFNSGLYVDWATVYANTIGVNNCASSTNLNGSSGSQPLDLSTSGYSYWALVQTALAFAVDLGAPGAAEAWRRLTTAPNYSPENFNNLPIWGIVPR